MKYILTSFALSILLLSLANCSTMQGFGQDVSSTGHAISKAASE